MERRGLLVVLSGPSGSGKGAIRTELLRRRHDAAYAVSATTRPPRPGEFDSVHYFFWSREEFSCRVADGSLCEWAQVYGHLYGTPRQPMEQWLASGKLVLVEKDVAGARRLMELYPEATFVFVCPPSLSELRSRLLGRGTDSRGVVDTRLEAAAAELRQAHRYDYMIVNDVLSRAAAQLNAIIEAELCRAWRVVELGTALLEG